MRYNLCIFDMDGTIADLYGTKNWLEDLRAERVNPYINARPLWDMRELAEVLNELKKVNIEIRISTWLSMDSSEDFKERTRTAKKEWCEKYGFPYDKFHGVAYGTTKADTVRRYLAEDETAILIDDNAKVRNGWHLGETIDPTAVDIIKELRKLL